MKEVRAQYVSVDEEGKLQGLNDPARETAKIENSDEISAVRTNKTEQEEISQ